MPRRVLLIGGTGLVGGLLAYRLLARGDEVNALLRRGAGPGAPVWQEHVAEPAAWPALARSLGGDVAISDLGTTWRAPDSEAAFRSVDFDMVVVSAAAAGAAGILHMITVSSVGSDPHARAFYLRV